MLSVAVLSGCLALALTGWGIWIRSALLGRAISDDWSRSLLAGLYAALLLGQLAPFSLGGGPILGVAFLAAGILFFVWYCRRWSRKDKLVCVASLALLILFVVALAPTTFLHFDTGLYHLQFVRWMSEHGTTVGLVNLHSRLAYNSSWLAAAALFARGDAWHEGPLIWQMTVVWLLYGALVYRAFRAYQTNRTLCFSFAAIAAAAIWWFPGITAFRQILQTDLPATLLVLLALALAIGALEGTEGDGDDCTALAMAVAAAATVKLSAAPAALLGLALWPLAKRLSRRELIALAVSATLLPTVWVLQNVALSGCLAFPVAASCTRLPWALPIDHVKSETAWISAWAKAPPHQPGDPIYDSFAWTVEWYATNKLIVLSWGFSLLAAAAIAFLGLLTGRKSSSLGPLIIPAVATACGLALWLFAAPDPRFGAGFVIGSIALAFAAALSTVPYSGVATIAIAMVVLMPSKVPEIGRMLIRARKAEARWNIPSATFETATTRYGYTVSVAKTDAQCWTKEPPCTPYFDSNLAIDKVGPFTLFTKKVSSPR